MRLALSDRFKVSLDTVEPRITASVFQSFEPFLKARGGNLDTLLDESSLTRQDLADPDNMISLNAAATILEGAARDLKDPCFGIHWAEKLPEGSAGVLGYLLLNAKSVRSAVRAVVRYSELHVEPVEASFEESEGIGRLWWRYPVMFTAPRLQLNSFIMAITIIRLRVHAGITWMPLGVDLEHRALDCAEEVGRILGPNVRFDQPVNTLLIREAVLDRSSPKASSRLYGLIRDLGERQLAERKASADIVQRTAKAIVDLLQEGEATLEEASNMLALSPRALQSQLAASDTNFETILHETRQSLAETYLRDTDLPLTEIAFLLGFSELSAFTRAANRWFGVPPRQFRVDSRNPA